MGVYAVLSTSQVLNRSLNRLFIKVLKTSLFRWSFGAFKNRFFDINGSKMRIRGISRRWGGDFDVADSMVTLPDPENLIFDGFWIEEKK